MLYMNDEHIRRIGIDWPSLVDTAEEVVRIADQGDYAQPLKPYLRYRDPKNRIIAMPAFVGGSLHAAGIKWIASFPGNRQAGLPRAHSVYVLNDPGTGKPVAVLNTALPSGIRTAAVSGLVLRYFLKTRPARRLKIGIIGWGPIGQLHYQMCSRLLGDRIEQMRLYDIGGIDPAGIPSPLRERTHIAACWQDVYADSDICITCTVSSERYIDLKPQPGRLLLHISLRDYRPSALEDVRAVVVDDWNEVCRENTDIERLHLERGLQETGVRSLADVVCRSALSEFGPEDPVLFCPMGLAAFDIGIASHYVKLAREQGIGTQLE